MIRLKKNDLVENNNWSGWKKNDPVEKKNDPVENNNDLIEKNCLYAWLLKVEYLTGHSAKAKVT